MHAFAADEAIQRVSIPDGLHRLFSRDSSWRHACRQEFPSRTGCTGYLADKYRIVTFFADVSFPSRTGCTGYLAGNDAG